MQKGPLRSPFGERCRLSRIAPPFALQLLKELTRPTTHFCRALYCAGGYVLASNRSALSQRACGAHGMQRDQFTSSFRGTQRHMSSPFGGAFPNITRAAREVVSRAGRFFRFGLAPCASGEQRCQYRDL
jgi:hypothetical protein